MPGAGRGGDDDVGDVGEEERALDRVRDVLGEPGGVDVLGAEGGELLDRFEDLVGELAGRDEYEAGGKGGGVGLCVGRLG